MRRGVPAVAADGNQRRRSADEGCWPEDVRGGVEQPTDDRIGERGQPLGAALALEQWRTISRPFDAPSEVELRAAGEPASLRLMASSAIFNPLPSTGLSLLAVLHCSLARTCRGGFRCMARPPWHAPHFGALRGRWREPAHLADATGGQASLLDSAQQLAYADANNVKAPIT